MKAIVLKQGSFQVEEVPKPEPQAGQVLVKLHYAALNHRDHWIRIGQYAKIQLPAILGSDGCGIVEIAGEGVNPSWIGKTVIINPNINWGPDPRYQQKDYQILGMPSQGTLAEYIAVGTDRLHEKPAYLSAEQAAAIPLGGLTAYNALFNKGHAQKNMNILISGVGGGVAQFAFLFALAIGANVYVTSSKDFVIDACMQLGGKGGCDYRNKDDLKNLSKAVGGFDVVIDSAGGDGMNDLLSTLQPTGKYVLYGATKGLPKELNLRKIFWDHLQLLGSTMGSDEDFFKMVNFCTEHKIQPILDKTFELENGVAAFDRMQSGEQFGKIIIKIA
jgi:NADPH:quinone reductase-like Zn-dependent oxidoreductase